MALEFQILTLALALLPGLVWLPAAAIHPGLAVRFSALLRVFVGGLAAVLVLVLFDRTMDWIPLVALLLLPITGAPVGLTLIWSRRSLWAWPGCISGWFATLGAFVCIAMTRAWGDHPGTSLISSSTQDSDMLLLLAIATWIGCWIADAALAVFTCIDGWVGRRRAAATPP